MVVSNALLASEPKQHNAVIRTPSTIGDVKGVAVDRQPAILCDWFQGTMCASLREAVVETLSLELGCATDCKTIPKAMRAYRKAIQFSDGAWLYYDNRYYKTCCVVLSGKSKPTHHLHLIKTLSALGVRATRIDLAFDDRRSVLSPADVNLAAESGNMVSRWKETSWRKTIRNSSGACVGQGIVVGSKTSAAYLSVYDKGLEDESEPEGDWIRWELRLADEQAKEFVDTFLGDNPNATDSDLRQYVARIKARKGVLCEANSGIAVVEAELTDELVVRFKRLALEALKARLSFRDRTTAINISRAVALPWWEQLLEYFDPVADEEFGNLNMDYEDGPSPKSRRKGREASTRRQAQELLTEIYDQKIRPYQPSLAEILGEIPDYGEQVSSEGAESSNEILSLAGLLPGKNNVVRLPIVFKKRYPGVAQDGVSKHAEVIPFPPAGIAGVKRKQSRHRWKRKEVGSLTNPGNE